MKIDQELINQIRKTASRSIAEELCSVQPMGPEVGQAFMDMIANGKSKEQLIEEGYEPVSKFGLMWVKKGTPDEN